MQVSESAIFLNELCNFAIVLSSLFLLLAKAFWTNQVQQWNARVHNQDSKRHTLWVCAPCTNHHYDKTDADTEDDLTPIAHRRGHIVSSHEPSTEHHTTSAEA